MVVATQLQKQLQQKTQLLQLLQQHRCRNTVAVNKLLFHYVKADYVNWQSAHTNCGPMISASLHWTALLPAQSKC